MALTGVRDSLGKLLGASAVYGIGRVLVRGLAFLLLPLYTRYRDVYGAVQALRRTLDE